MSSTSLIKCCVRMSSTDMSAMSRRIFLPPKEWKRLERGARSRGMTVQEYVNWAVYILEGVK